MIFRHGLYRGFLACFPSISDRRRSRIFLAMAVPPILVADMVQREDEKSLGGQRRWPEQTRGRRGGGREIPLQLQQKGRGACWVNARTAGSSSSSSGCGGEKAEEAAGSKHRAEDVHSTIAMLLVLWGRFTRTVPGLLMGVGPVSRPGADTRRALFLELRKGLLRTRTKAPNGLCMHLDMSLGTSGQDSRNQLLSTD